MYDVEMLNGYVKINTLSPNGRYYYRLTKPKEEAMSIFAADIAFFDKKGVMIYCTKDKPASSLPPFEFFQNVLWLNKGEYAFFIEYKRDESYANILSLDNKLKYKRNLKLDDNIESIIDTLKSKKEKLKEAFLIENNFILSKELDIGFFREGIFKKWFPKR